MLSQDCNLNLGPAGGLAPGPRAGPGAPRSTRKDTTLSRDHPQEMTLTGESSNEKSEIKVPLRLTGEDSDVRKARAMPIEYPWRDSISTEDGKLLVLVPVDANYPTSFSPPGRISNWTRRT